MLSNRSMSSDKLLNEIQHEYHKFINISKKKFSNHQHYHLETLTSATMTTVTTTQLIGYQTVAGSQNVASNRKTKSQSSVFKKISLFSSKKVTAEFQIIECTDLPEKKKNLHFTLPTIWKKPEPLKRPDGLQLNLIGVALFKGNEIFSKAIRKLTKSRYSHVALLMHDVTKEKSDSDGWYIYSANGSASQILHDHRFPQVQLEKWSDIMEKYDGAAGVRMILFHPRSSPTTNYITELVDKYLGLPYETHLLVMLRAMNRSNVEAEDHAKSAFCSEICYRFLVSCGVIENTEIPENVWPKDFSDENDKLLLKNGVWGDVIVHRGHFAKFDNEESFDCQDHVVKL